MNNIELFTGFYKSDLSGTYHSTDRLVLNGYYNMGCTLGASDIFGASLNEETKLLMITMKEGLPDAFSEE